MKRIDPNKVGEAIDGIRADLTYRVPKYRESSEAKPIKNVRFVVDTVIEPGPGRSELKKKGIFAKAGKKVVRVIGLDRFEIDGNQLRAEGLSYSDTGKQYRDGSPAIEFWEAAIRRERGKRETG